MGSSVWFKGWILLLFFACSEVVSFEKKIEVSNAAFSSVKSYVENVHQREHLQDEKEKQYLLYSHQKPSNNKQQGTSEKSSFHFDTKNQDNLNAHKIFGDELPLFVHPGNNQEMLMAHMHNVLTQQLELLGDDFEFDFSIPTGEVDDNGKPILKSQRIDPPFVKELLDRILDLFPKWGDDGEDDGDDNNDNNDKEIDYRIVPVDTEELLWGLLTGILYVFMPTMAESDSGAETMAKFQMCFDPRKLREQFYVKDLFKMQEGEEEISTKDIDEFVSLLTDDSGDKFALRNIFSTLGSMTSSAKKVYRHVVFILHRLAPYLINLVKHAYNCGMLDVVIGMLVTFVLGLLPFLLFILVPVAIGFFAYEMYSQVRSLIENWNQDWFLFGKSAGALIGYVALIFIVYKINKYRENKAGIRCDNSGSVRCGATMPDNEMKYWSDKKNFNGNKVYQRDGLIDPFKVDTRGRTNMQRMSKGLSPLGPDDLPVNLHHMDQTPGGAIAELTQTFHKKNHGALHQFLGDSPSKIDRAVFATWRRQYWISRAAELSTRLANAPSGGGGIPWNVIAPFAGKVVRRGVDIVEASSHLNEFVDEIMGNYTEGMAWNDLIGWTINILQGTIRQTVSSTEEEMAQKITPLQTCSWDPTCQSSMTLSNMDHQDGVLVKDIPKIYEIPLHSNLFVQSNKRNGNGGDYALSVSIKANQGALSIRMPSLSSSKNSRRLTTHISSLNYDHNSKYSHEFKTALYSCDMIDDDSSSLHQTIEIKATAVGRKYDQNDIQTARDWEGADVDKIIFDDETEEQAFYDLVVQKVPVPTLDWLDTSSSSSTHQEIKKGRVTSSKVTLHFPKANGRLSRLHLTNNNNNNNNEEENNNKNQTPLMTYHVYAHKGKSNKNTIMSICNILAISRRAGTIYEYDETFASHKSNDSNLQISAKGLAPDTGYSLYVVAENSAGAMTAYPPVYVTTEKEEVDLGLLLGLSLGLGLPMLAVALLLAIALGAAIFVGVRYNKKRKQKRGIDKNDDMAFSLLQPETNNNNNNNDDDDTHINMEEMNQMSHSYIPPSSPSTTTSFNKKPLPPVPPPRQKSSIQSQSSSNNYQPPPLAGNGYSLLHYLTGGGNNNNAQNNY